MKTVRKSFRKSTAKIEHCCDNIATYGTKRVKAAVHVVKRLFQGVELYAFTLLR